ncbi:hydroxyacylglutathione hydrolase [Pseudoscourfieldia marina]
MAAASRLASMLLSHAAHASTTWRRPCFQTLFTSMNAHAPPWPACSNVVQQRWYSSAAAAAAASSAQVSVVPCLKDNYAYVMHGGGVPVTVVDPGEAVPVERELARLGVAPEYVLLTHHHDDHVGGVTRIKEAHPNVKVVYCEADRDRMPVSADVAVSPSSTFALGDLQAEVIDTGGHTRHHVAFHIADAGVVFTGDALFVLGCGRLFEGTAEQMHESLARLAALPPKTRVYAGHEYSVANADFARAIDPKNAGLRARANQLRVLRSAGMPTLPTTIESERELNIFLRASEKEIADSVSKSVGEEVSDPVNVFAALRRLKDNA